MRLTILKGCCGGIGGVSGGRKSASKSKAGLISNNFINGSSRGGNNVAITGSIVLLLIWSFVGGCWGKAFHSGGQAEIEEDTTQGSLKEKFLPGSLVGSSGPGSRSSLIDDPILEDDGDDVDGEEDVDTVMVGNVGLLGSQDDPSQRWTDYKAHRHGKHPVGNNNYVGTGAVVQKRSLGGGRSVYSFDDGGGDDEDYQRFQRLTRGGGEVNKAPMYYDQNGSGAPAPVSGSTNSNMRQKLMHLRGQYGDKWMAFMGPYAYRKRQILYRQCFFNPISCF